MIALPVVALGVPPVAAAAVLALEKVRLNVTPVINVLGLALTVMELVLALAQVLVQVAAVLQFIPAPAAAVFLVMVLVKQSAASVQVVLGVVLIVLRLQIGNVVTLAFLIVLNVVYLVLGLTANGIGMQPVLPPNMLPAPPALGMRLYITLQGRLLPRFWILLKPGLFGINCPGLKQSRPILTSLLKSGLQTLLS